MSMMLAAALMLAAADPPRPGAPAAFTGPAELVIRNAAVHTMTTIRSRATALAVHDGRFVAVGGESDVRPLIGPATRVIDLKGRTVLPGLIDAHGHMLSLGGRIADVDVVGTPTYEAVIARIAARARSTPKGQWILGRGWDQNDWPRTAMPHHAALSRAVPDHPVRMTRIDGHAVLVNRRALEAAGITRDTKDPSGGAILRDAKGEPTGVLVDAAMALVGIPEITQAERERRLLLAMKECARLGLTMVHDAGISEADMDAYRTLLERGQFPIRIYAMARATRDGGDLADEIIARGTEVGDRLTLRAVKVSVDGALGSRGALLGEPYTDQPGHHGLPVFPLEKLRVIAKQAADAGIQVRVHAIGDSANHGVLDAFEAAFGAAGNPGARWAIEHAQIVRPADVARFARLGVVASIQPTHATSDGPWAETRLGAERVRWGYTWRTFLDGNVAIASGSDFPVESTNPMLGLYAAVTRRDLEGRLPATGWFPEQRLTIHEALKSFTLDGAWLAFREGDLGSIDVGKQADFVVLDRDIIGVPPAEITKAKVLMTVVGGKTEFETAK